MTLRAFSPNPPPLSKRFVVAATLEHELYKFHFDVKRAFDAVQT